LFDLNAWQILYKGKILKNQELIYIVSPFLTDASKGQKQKYQHFVKQRHFVKMLTRLFGELENSLLIEFCYFQFKNGLSRVQYTFSVSYNSITFESTILEQL